MVWPKIFDFQMMRKWCIFSINGTLDFEFWSFPGLAIWSRMLSPGAREWQWTPAPSQACDHNAKQPILYSDNLQVLQKSKQNLLQKILQSSLDCGLVCRFLTQQTSWQLSLYLLPLLSCLTKFLSKLDWNPTTSLKLPWT